MKGRYVYILKWLDCFVAENPWRSGVRHTNVVTSSFSRNFYWGIFQQLNISHVSHQLTEIKQLHSTKEPPDISHHKFAATWPKELPVSHHKIRRCSIIHHKFHDHQKFHMTGLVHLPSVRLWQLIHLCHHLRKQFISVGFFSFISSCCFRIACIS